MIEKRIRQSFFLTIFLLMILLVGCTNPPEDIYPWPTSSPEEQGMDAQILKDMLASVEEQQLNLHSLLVIRNGTIVSETYWDDYTATSLHKVYSCTKSVMSTLIGIAIDQDFLEGTDQRLVEFFPDASIDNLDDQKRAITLDDILTMRSGLAWNSEDLNMSQMYQSGVWLDFMLDRAVDLKPGSSFRYCTGCSHLLSGILRQSTGKNPVDYANEYLFGPLGITEYDWEANTDGLPAGGWGLQLTPRDMAKLGYLFLNEGMWDGKQIVPAAWVEEATRIHTYTDGTLAYGYQWWVYPTLNAYAALGMNGQTIFVIPESSLIIVTTADVADHTEIFKLIEDFVVPAVQPE